MGYVTIVSEICQSLIKDADPNDEYLLKGIQLGLNINEKQISSSNELVVKGGEILLIPLENDRECRACVDPTVRYAAGSLDNATIHEMGHQLGLGHEENTFICAELNKYIDNIVGYQKNLLRCRKKSPGKQ